MSHTLSEPCKTSACRDRNRVIESGPVRLFWLQEYPMFGSLGLPELLVILFIVILVFGASRLPELGKGIGKGIKNFKDATKDGLSDKKLE
jgi:sec-independent protein translocase protein TatA